MDLDLGGESETMKKLETKNSNSKLHKSIQELVTLIFDIESMKKALVEFEVWICACSRFPGLKSDPATFFPVDRFDENASRKIESTTDRERLRDPHWSAHDDQV